MIDPETYKKFTWRQTVDKAMHSLEGILKGIAVDNEINVQEVALLKRWCEEHSAFMGRHPLSEIYPIVRDALQDGIIDDEEKEDILWLCERFSTDNEFFDAITSDMQRLQGIMAGIAADGVIEEEEIRQLDSWLSTHDHLTGCWPYDELNSLITEVLKDGCIDDDEHDLLFLFFTDFLSLGDHKAIDTPIDQETMHLHGVCASCPEVAFPGQMFCFTGKSDKVSRDELSRIILELGGRFSRKITKSVDYLVVGAAGNPAWAFACYGRKVEVAMRLRKEGLHLLIVHENDFWDAVEDSR